MSKQFEGTWEEASANASDFEGHRVRVTLLEDERDPGQRGGAVNRTGAPEPKPTDVFRSVIPGRRHGKLYKEWVQEVTTKDISPDEFDAFESAIAENRAIRRALAQDSND